MSDDKDKRPGDGEPSDIKPVSITDEMQRSYLDYAMSVIVSRALPDVRDGLKPVHRRIIFAMHEEGRTPDRKYVKSASTVGDVMGRYHPHGDQSIYDALVRMAQTFSMRLLLVDGQGNFGSVDGDPPAAMRYTESRMSRAAVAMIDDIDKDTVDFQETYDGVRQEPVVLPSRFPNLLVNGAGGIAVGMATNIPPHNLGEVIDACLAYIEDPAISIEALMEIVPGPDFPTGAQIIGRSGIRNAYLTGRGSIIMRASAAVEEIRKDREAIVVTAIPYQVNKATLQERIAELVREKRLEGISEVRDESDRQGMRLVIELKRDAVGDVVLNQLYRFTSLQSNFGANMVALNGGKPEVMNLKDFIRAFVDFREEVISRRTKHLLTKARERAHILCGLATAVANIDEVIRIIRTSPDPNTARESLMSRDWPAGDIAPLIALVDDPKHPMNADGTYRLSEAQARAILDLRLQRLTALGREEIGEELTKLAEQIADYLDILRSRSRIMSIVRNELSEIKAAHATPRMTGDSRLRTLISRTRTSSSVKTWSSLSAMPATSSGYRFRPIVRSIGAARAVPACRLARRISSPGSSSPILILPSSSFRRRDAFTRRRSGGCRSLLHRRGVRHSSTCCPSRTTSASPRSCRCPRTSPPGKRFTSCSPPRQGPSGATIYPTSSRSIAQARSR